MSHQRISQISSNKLLHLLHKNLINRIPNTMSFIRVTIASLNKTSLKQIATLLIVKLNVLPTAFPYIRWYLLSR